MLRNSAKDVIYYRGIERILSTLSGLVAIVLGGLLYKWGIFDKTEVNLQGGKLAPSVVLKNASPGVIFCLFGMVLLAYGIGTQAVIDEDVKHVGQTLNEVSKPTGHVVITYSQQDKENLESFLDSFSKYRTAPPESEFKNLQDSAKRYLEQLRKAK